MKKICLLLTILSILLLTGCSETIVKYQCVDGSFVDNIAECGTVTCPATECPKLDCEACPAKVETRTVTNTITKYQCYDDSIKDNKEDCSSLEERGGAGTTVSGSSNQVTEKFYLKEGLTIFRNHYEGELNFIAELINEDGTLIGIIANTIGTSDTSSAKKITEAGFYRIEVTAWEGSSWTIDIEQ
ncbi:MAG: hypothetical protein PHO02_01040 [Candidatus Nanoarchaeia archaeon]|nr:hypothetical protein [Candidatus Nanoarchaeia archaeon]